MGQAAYWSADLVMLVFKKINGGVMFDRNNKKKPLSEREREALKLLRDALPEYEIYANMRLADVIKADWRQFNYIKGFHLDYVICDQDGHTIAAVELDDSTHDNLKAQERDAKKNKWLSDAGIKLIRIRQPQEAIGIRQLIDGYKSSGFAQASWRPQPHSNIRTVQINNVKNPFQNFVILMVGVFVFWLSYSFISNNMLKRNSQQALLMQQRLASQQNEALKRNQAAENLLRQQEVAVQQQPKYERILIRGKSARECARPDGTLDNYTVLCMRDHEEVVLVSGRP